MGRHFMMVHRNYLDADDRYRYRWRDCDREPCTVCKIDYSKKHLKTHKCRGPVPEGFVSWKAYDEQ